MREGELLTMGGGGQELFTIRGAGRASFWGNKNSSLKIIQTPRSEIIINICAVKNVTTRGSPKNCYGGKPKNNHPSPCGKRDPPPPPPPHRKKCSQHGENVYTFCTHRKNAPEGEKKPPPPYNFFIHAPPPSGECLLFLPLTATADHDIHSLYSVCLRELEKINKN